MKENSEDRSLIQVTDPLGNETHYSYDTNGNVSSIMNGLGIVTTCEYDGKGNQIAIHFMEWDCR